MKTLFSYSAVLLLAFSTLADPTRPAPGYIEQANRTMAVSSGSALQLQLIHHSHHGKAATINGQFLQPGDQYQGYTLTDISNNTVVLIRGDEQRILQLHKKMIKNYDE
ncbi:hypothetical protein [Arsukibacterium sp.]|uniref:hypothetical protein n=1 Tax=Arsukibacterium sp. TaxID=1977258 RepID=UPI00299DDA52|nr:hypothetical protein [Arsukibacterium sp.]MDX1678790.1 hypothetical protein [Arsukibacterium sp.]